MRSSVYTKHLEHAPATVSAFLADLRNDPSWRQEVTGATLVSGAPGDEGSHYVEQVAWEGVHAEASLAVTEVISGSRLVVVARDPGYQSEFEYTFAPSEAGTDLKLVMSIETLGPLQLVEPFMWALITRWVERDLDALDSALSRAVAGEP